MSLLKFFAFGMVKIPGKIDILSLTFYVSVREHLLKITQKFCVSKYVLQRLVTYFW